MPRRRREVPQRGDKRKTLYTTGWHRDPRFRFLPLVAKELYRVLWDIGRDEMRELLPLRFSDTRYLADEVGSGVTPDEVNAALERLSRARDGNEPLIDILPGVGLRIRGLRAIHSALEAWKDADRYAPPDGAVPPCAGPQGQGERPQDESVPLDGTAGAQRESALDATGNRLETSRDRTVQDSTGQDRTGNGVSAAGSTSPRRPPPEPLARYRLFLSDRALVRRWEELYTSWQELAGVDVDEQLVRAHNYALGKEADGHPYRNYVRFLRDWMLRAQDYNAKRSKPSRRKPHEISDEEARRALAESEREAPW